MTHLAMGLGTTARAAALAPLLASLLACGGRGSAPMGHLDGQLGPGFGHAEGKKAGADQSGPSGDGDAEKQGADEPVQVTGAFLACANVQDVTPPSGKAYVACGAFDDDGDRVPLKDPVWTVTDAKGNAQLAQVQGVDDGTGDVYVVVDQGSLGTAIIAAATRNAGTLQAPAPAPAAPLSPLAIDVDLSGDAKTLGEVCRGNISAQTELKHPGACPAGSAVVFSSDGAPLRFVCCPLPGGVLTNDGKSTNVRRDATCAAGEVQTGFADVSRPLCTKLVSDFELAASVPAVRVGADDDLKAKMHDAEAADVEAQLSRDKAADACFCPDLRMVMTGGHDKKGGSCKDVCALIVQHGDAGKVDTKGLAQIQTLTAKIQAALQDTKGKGKGKDR